MAAEQPAPTPASSTEDRGILDERPELFVGAAFVGGIVLAQALRLIGR
jgi:hypothetical protein